jgi:hypothetical protein
MAHKDSQVSRRSMLKMSGGTLAVAGVGAVTGHWQIPRLHRFRVRDVDAAAFLPYVGNTFLFQEASEDRKGLRSNVELRLAKVESHKTISRIESQSPAEHGKRNRESFSLLFHQNAGEPLSAGIYRLDHANFKDFHIFLSPVGTPGKNGTVYLEAIFS